MISFEQTQQEFNYIFGFTTKTGENNWSLTFEADRGCQIFIICLY